MENAYVHGYTVRENTRLFDQAATLADLLHADSLFPPGSRVLEAGCGTGAQTVTIARNNPGSFFTSVDISDTSLAQARNRANGLGLSNVHFQQADIFALPFEQQSFDHVFLCFVLEHLKEPAGVLAMLKRYLKPGGTITLIEGDHGSAYFHPNSEAAHRAVSCQVELQKRAGGNAMIGRELYPLLSAAGYGAVRVSPRMVYVDASKPHLMDGFTRKTFTAMIEGVREPALNAGLLDAATFDQGIRDLYRTADPDGVFCYTFFKAMGTRD